MKRALFLATILMLLLPAAIVPADAVPQNVTISAPSAILYQPETQDVLFEKNADTPVPSANLTQLMTLLIVSEELKKGTIKLTDEVEISKNAWLTGHRGSTMFLEVGTHYSVQDLMKGLTVDTGNDAAVALAEYVSGSTDKFVALMNQRAQELGMKNTHFVSVDGLVENSSYDTTTARDMMVLANYYISHFPDNLKLHELPNYTTKTRLNDIKQPNANPLIAGGYQGATGLISGSIGGHYNIVATVKRNGLSFIAVVLGEITSDQRDQSTYKLLNYGFNSYTTVGEGKKGDVVSQIHVFKSKGIRNANVLLSTDASIQAKKTDVDKIKVTDQLPDYLTGGQKAGDVIGKRLITLNGKTKTYDLILANNLPSASAVQDFFDSIAIQIMKLLHHITK